MPLLNTRSLKAAQRTKRPEQRQTVTVTRLELYLDLFGVPAMPAHTHACNKYSTANIMVEEACVKIIC